MENQCWIAEGEWWFGSDEESTELEDEETKRKVYLEYILQDQPKERVSNVKQQQRPAEQAEQMVAPYRRKLQKLKKNPNVQRLLKAPNPRKAA